MSKSLNNNPEIKIIVGVTGGIAAYKSAELVRCLKQHRFDVRVVMTNAAMNFITPMTLQAVSGYPVYHQLFDCQATDAMEHIELAKWADVILIAPATANCLSKIALGLADDLLSTLILASQASLIVAPAMNQQMWASEAIVNNVQQLKNRNVLLIGPDSGEQACGDLGFGRMSEPVDIVDQILLFCGDRQSLLNGKQIVITAGPTVEAIDPVRFISNHSSGKMGYALAEMAAAFGAKVTLISGPVSLPAPTGVQLDSVVSAQQMLTAVKQSIGCCDIFIGCAAVSDYAPEQIAEQKIKKDRQQMQIKLIKNPDILAWVAAQGSVPFVVGFAAESENLKSFAQKKLLDKKLDMICANDISNLDLGFNSEKNEILILNKNGSEIKLPISSKKQTAIKILDAIEKNYPQ